MRSSLGHRLACLLVVGSAIVAGAPVAALAAPSAPRCGSLEMMRDGLARRRAHDHGRTPDPGPPPPEKAVRDAYGAWENSFESDNFAVKWGAEGEWTSEDAALLASHFEEAWVVEIEISSSRSCAMGGRQT